MCLRSYILSPVALQYNSSQEFLICIGIKNIFDLIKYAPKSFGVTINVSILTIIIKNIFIGISLCDYVRDI